MAEKLIYLVRHAQPDFPGGEKLCLGRKMDLPLSAEGLAQSQRLSRFFDHLPLEAVYTSPLLRARQTAQAISGDKTPLVPLEDLIELDGGEWDGMPFAKIYEQYPDRSLRPACPPGGEPDETGLARMHTALSFVASRTAHTAAIVAHGGVNRLLLCDLLGRPQSDKRLLAQDYAAVSLLALEDGAWTVRQLGLTPDALLSSAALPSR